MPSLSTSFSTQGATPLARNDEAVLKPGQFSKPITKALFNNDDAVLKPGQFSSPKTKALTSMSNSKPSTQVNKAPGLIQNKPVMSTQNQQNYPQSNPQQSVVPQATTANINSMQPNIGSMQYDIQNNLPIGTSSTGTPAPQAPTYGGMINRATNLAEDAAKTNLIIERAKMDALNNPNFSLDTGVGRAGLIAQNYGLMGQNATTLAQNATELAGKLAPVQVPYGNQYLNPTTGQPVNPQAGQNMQDAVSLQVQKVLNKATTPELARQALSAYGQAGVDAFEKAVGVGFNPTVATANQASATDLIKQKNDLQSTFNGVDSNFQLLINTAQAGGVNQSNVPILNTLQNNVKMGLSSDQAVNNFKNTLANVRAMYALILGNGSPTVGDKQQAQEAIRDDISIDALKSLGEQLKAEANNRINGIDQQIKTLTGQVTQSPSQTTGSSIYDF